MATIKLGIGLGILGIVAACLLVVGCGAEPPAGADAAVASTPAAGDETPYADFLCWCGADPTPHTCTCGFYDCNGTCSPPPQPPGAVCGDGKCSGGENCASCAQDCGACPPPPPCGGECGPQEYCDMATQQCLPDCDWACLCQEGGGYWDGTYCW